MKKICLAIIFSLLFCMAGFAHSMPASELAVGGISLRSTLGYVKSVYGEPAQIQSSVNPMGNLNVYVATYGYGPLLTIGGRTFGSGSQNENEYKVYEVTLKANNLSTPSGLTVGMPYAAVITLFGKGEYYYNTSMGMGGYVYSMQNSLQEMILYLDGDNNIAAIYLGEDY